MMFWLFIIIFPFCKTNLQKCFKKPFLGLQRGVDVLTAGKYRLIDLDVLAAVLDQLFNPVLKDGDEVLLHLSL